MERMVQSDQSLTQCNSVQDYAGLKGHRKLQTETLRMLGHNRKIQSVRICTMQNEEHSKNMAYSSKCRVHSQYAIGQRWRWKSSSDMRQQQNECILNKWQTCFHKVRICKGQEMCWCSLSLIFGAEKQKRVIIIFLIFAWMQESCFTWSHIITILQYYVKGYSPLSYVCTAHKTFFKDF